MKKIYVHPVTENIVAEVQKLLAGTGVYDDGNPGGDGGDEAKRNNNFSWNLWDEDSNTSKQVPSSWDKLGN